ncbi:MAG TPA: alpha/beta family hydrolase [Candidatus Angelobacter sp.]|nr:alpha/beta family hydrolase [Candidatus Angelobacter sp.]
MRGFLHTPENANGHTLVLTHGAGGNCESKLLVAVSQAFSESGFLVLRINLPFRQQRPFGPPFPAAAARDREGLKRAAELNKERAAGKVFLGGHSYGGRQSTILAAENPALVDGLLLFSYPLHPPRKPLQLRTAHFPSLKTPSLFVHGTRDPFGLVEELRPALELIPARHDLLPVEGGGHDLVGKKPSPAFPAEVVRAFREFFAV